LTAPQAELTKWPIECETLCLIFPSMIIVVSLNHLNVQPNRRQNALTTNNL
jgi:hypothetical protein